MSYSIVLLDRDGYAEEVLSGIETYEEALETAQYEDFDYIVEGTQMWNEPLGQIEESRRPARYWAVRSRGVWARKGRGRYIGARAQAQALGKRSSKGEEVEAILNRSMRSRRTRFGKHVLEKLYERRGPRGDVEIGFRLTLETEEEVIILDISGVGPESEGVFIEARLESDNYLLYKGGELYRDLVHYRDLEQFGPAYGLEAAIHEILPRIFYALHKKQREGAGYSAVSLDQDGNAIDVLEGLRSRVEAQAIARREGYDCVVRGTQIYGAPVGRIKEKQRLSEFWYV